MDGEKIVTKNNTDLHNAKGDQPVANSRRRLFRQGASVVAVTLVSRPVLAWHCKSPSAWGSELINPHTSLKTNAGHNTYADETWTITNWTNNSERAGLGKPWKKLKERFGLQDKKRSEIKLNNVPGLTIPNGLSSDYKIIDLLASGTQFQKYIVVAQLNRLLLAGNTNGIDECLRADDLQKMALNNYPTSGTPWSETDIVTYLDQNWIVKP